MKNKVKAKLDNGGVLMNDFSRMFIDKYYNKEYPLFKFIIDKSNQQIAFADMKGNIVYVNDSWARNHGYMVKELVGKNLSIFHTKEELKKVHKFNKILVKKGKYVGEIEHKRRDGSTFVTLMDNFIFEPKKGLKFMVGMATDISEYKKNQLEVKKSANYLDLMAESLVVLNQDRKIVKINKAFTKLWGYKEAEIIGKNIWKLFPRRQREIHEFNMKESIQKKKAVKFETYILTKEKKEIQTQMIGSVIFDKNGNLSDMIALFRDIRKEKLIKLKMFESEKKLSAIIENMGGGLFVIDKDFKVILFNKSAENITGFSSSDIIGKKYNNNIKFVFENSGNLGDAFIYNCIKKGEIVRLQNHTQIVKKDITKVSVSSSAAPIKNEQGEIVGGIILFYDVSREREIDKMKSEFVSLASHQLKTPLTGIKWFTELLSQEKNTNLTEEQKDFIKQIYISNERLIQLVSDLLDVSHIDTGRKFDIVLEIDDIVKIFNNVLEDKDHLIKEKRIKFIKCVNTPDRLDSLVDSKKIRQVFNSIVDNAIKYSNIGGVVEMGCDRSQKGKIIFSIKDNGIGIPKDVQKNLFNKFVRADNAIISEADGTGLGLYIAKAIIKAHGGEIWFESKLGKGSTFYFSLP